MEVISRQEAIRQGLKVYFTGEPCAHGHIAPRRVGKNNECLACKALRDAEYAAKNKAAKSAYDAERRVRLSEKLATKSADYRAANRELLNERARLARIADPERFKGYQRSKAEIRAEQARAWRQANKERKAAYCKAYELRKKAESPSYRLSVSLRQRLATAVRSGAKAGSAVRDLGCSIDFLKAYLESNFLPGMSWENWGRKGWHIDHIRPLASFEMTDPEQVKAACHYTNLQPLWWQDNLSKGART